ncbi:sensor histidine kinase [Flavitalea sp.]|nr:histidine kinase [Flavitalea sp.]
MFAFRIFTDYSQVKRLLRHLLFWIAYYLYDGPISAIIETDPLARVQIAALALPVKIVATYATLYLVKQTYQYQSKSVRFYLYLLLSIVFFGCLQRLVSYTIIYPVYYPDGLNVGLWYLPKVIIETFGVYSVVAIVVVLHVGKQWYQSQQEKQQLRNEKLEAELQFLKAQIHPHFLFNTLNNLYALTVTQSKKAPEIVDKLSQLLNYMLYDSNKTEVSLQKEVAYIENYITLEKIRYEDRLDVSLNIFDNIENIVVAPLLILPFVENSFKHGFGNDIGKVWVNINILISKNQLIIKVENSKCSAESSSRVVSSGGIGLTNVKKRLELIYKDRHELNIVNEDTYLVVLKIKL